MMMETFRDSAIEKIACLAGQVVGDGLKEITLIPWGEIKSKKGTFILDETAARLIVEAFESHGTPIPIDWEHQTLGGRYAAPDGRSPASGWVHKLFWQSGLGLRGLVEWTDKARNAIRDGEYRYLSPVIFVRK